MIANNSPTRLWYILGFLCALCMAEDIPSRHLSIYLNPGCSVQNCTSNDTTLVYVEAKGSNDTIHYLWSNIGRPTALIVQTDPQAVLDVNWEKLLSNDSQMAIRFSSNPLYSMALVVQKLWQFDDYNDTADVSTANASLDISNDFSSFAWSDVNASLSCSDSRCSATFLVLPDNETISQDGKLSFQFTASGKLGRAPLLPHLQLSLESTQLEVLFDNMVLQYDSSRFALEVMFFATEPRVAVDEKPHMETSMDDEYTPGVFTQEKFQTPRSKNESNQGSYAYWKPVAYLKPERTVIFSTDVTVGTVSNASEETPLPHSIAQSFFNPSDTLLLTSNITFGGAGDGFFTKTNYSSWSLVIGLGQPPVEKLSTMVILIISIGLGAPLILMIVGVVYMTGRKLFTKKDELLLSRDEAT